MWHSKLATGERGIIVDFKKPVELEEFEILTRRDCCNHRYEFVCLHVDDLKVKFLSTIKDHKMILKTFDKLQFGSYSVE